MDLNKTIDDINNEWESTFASVEEEVRDEVFPQFPDYEEILLTCRLYHIEENKFGLEVDLNATDHVPLDEVKQEGNDDFDDENYFFAWVVNEYVDRLYDWADEKYNGGFHDDITEAIVESEGPLLFCEKKLIWNDKEVWKEEW